MDEWSLKEAEGRLPYWNKSVNDMKLNSLLPSVE